MKNKKLAFEAVKKFNLKIEYDIGPTRWTVNVCAPDGYEFEKGLTMLCTSWLTKPNDDFWGQVLMDIKNYGPEIKEAF